MNELPSCVGYLIQAAHRAPSADNMQPWRFVWSRDVLTIAFASDRMNKAVMGPRALATLLSIGAVMENLDQAATAAGIHLEWLNGPASDAGVYARLRIPQLKCPVPHEAWKHPLFQRHTNRGSCRRRPLPANLLATISKCGTGNAQIRMASDAGTRARLARLTRDASEMRFRNREIHEWFIASLRWNKASVATGTGLDLASLALPPGGRLFLRAIARWSRLNAANRIGAYRLLAALETLSLRRGPALAMILAPADADGAIAAGRTMERAWILLNDNGVAVQPFFVLPDQLDRLRENKLPRLLVSTAAYLEAATHQIIGSDQLQLMMVLRLGYPCQAAVRSFRLPWDVVTALEE